MAVSEYAALEKKRRDSERGAEIKEHETEKTITTKQGRRSSYVDNIPANTILTTLSWRGVVRVKDSRGASHYPSAFSHTFSMCKASYRVRGPLQLS